MKTISKILSLPFLLIVCTAADLHSNAFAVVEAAKCASFQSNNTQEWQAPCCAQGPRGHRGHRGKKGRPGPTGATGVTGVTGAAGPLSFTDELFINADMMANADSDAQPDRLFLDTYGLSPLDAWSLSLGGEQVSTIGMQFVIPSTLDTTQPVVLTLHCFQGEEFVTPILGDVQLQAQLDYKSNGQLLGVVPPATGYAQTLLTPLHSITTPIFDTNLRYFTLSVQLDPTLMAGKTWGFIVITRADLGNDNYGNLIYLTEASIQYTKINS